MPLKKDNFSFIENEDRDFPEWFNNIYYTLKKAKINVLILNEICQHKTIHVCSPITKADGNPYNLLYKLVQNSEGEWDVLKDDKIIKKAVNPVFYICKPLLKF